MVNTTQMRGQARSSEGSFRSGTAARAHLLELKPNIGFL